MIPRESEASDSSDENDGGNGQDDGGSDSGNESESSPDSPDDSNVDDSSNPDTSANDASDVADDTDPSNDLREQSDTVSRPDSMSGEPDLLNDIPSEPAGLGGTSSPEEPPNPYDEDDSSLPNDLPASPFDKPSKDTNNDAKQLTSNGSQSSETDPKLKQDLINDPKSNIVQPEKGTSNSEPPRLIDALLSFGSKILDSLFGTDKPVPSPEKQAVTVPPYLQPYAKIPGVVGNPRLTPEVIQEIERIAAKYNQSSIDLMKVMSFESGSTFDPAKRNAAGSSAVGVIQFMKETAKGLGTTTQDLSKMTLLEQLKYVDKYLSQYADKLKRNPGIEGLYMSVLYPKAISKSPDYVLFKEGTKEYEQNKGLDTNKDSTITVKEASDKPRNRIVKPSSKSSNSKSKGKPSKSKGKPSKGSSSTPLS
jgi:hypothetical protein